MISPKRSMILKLKSQTIGMTKLMENGNLLELIIPIIKDHGYILKLIIPIMLRMMKCMHTKISELLESTSGKLNLELCLIILSSPTALKRPSHSWPRPIAKIKMVKRKCLMLLKKSNKKRKKPSARKRRKREKRGKPKKKKMKKKKRKPKRKPKKKKMKKKKRKP